MKISVFCVGKTASNEIKSLMNFYIQRLPKHWNFEFTELPDAKNGASLSPENLKKEEAKIILPHLENCDKIILLDENGKQYTSRNFAKKIQDWQNISVKKVAFVIGGAFGFSEEIYTKSHEKISLSSMTFTHQMIRLFFVEQLYRADQILQGKPYHND